MIARWSVRVTGLHVNTKIKEIKNFFAPLRIENAQFFKNGVCLVSFRKEEDVQIALAKHGQIHGRNIRVSVCTKKSTESEDDTNDSSCVKPSWPVKTAMEIKSAIRESGRLFVRNLSYECSEEELEKLFSAYGSLSDIHISYDVRQQVSKGIAFVTYLFPADAVKAFEKLDKTKFMGRLLHILPAEDPPERESTQPGPKSSDNQNRPIRSEYQETKYKDLKASATTAHNWNALFIRPDAVATYLAAKFGLTKEQVLDPSGRGSVGVRLALAETQLVTEMREFLQKHQINLDAFNASSSEPESANPSSARRDRLDVKASSTHRQISGTAFLIKNLPVGTTEVEVRELLQRYTKQLRHESPSESAAKRCHPKRVIVPPLGITAIVEYAMAQQARLVYRSLAYEPYKDNVLYVQWLPHGALLTDSTPNVDVDGGAITDPAKNADDSGNCQSEFELITSIPDEATGQIEVKEKISKKTNKRQRLELETPKQDQIADTPIVKKRKYKNKKERLQEQTDEPEQPIQTEPETAEVVEEVQTKAPTISKPVLLVRNVSFQATKQELTELFQPIGGLVRIRLPQKAAGGHRGFAFVEFASVDQAKTAKETLGTDTHFLGRRLQIEFAQQ